MEAVKSFNLELSSLYEVKPPISKAKMTALTRGAIKAIKFYKHVVQSVEKFILKCKPEYKVPGLYVIDSIVRQSRHQFGPEKDVFAPRFSKNLQQTFVNLFKCPPEDKSKIIRVLNLWQKNQVFSPDAIQPLFDLADPNNPIHQQIQQLQQQSTPMQQTNGSQSQVVKGSPALQRTPTKVNQSTASEASAANLSLTEPVLQQLQQLQRLLTKGADTHQRQEQVHFDKKLLDFDYDEDEEEVNPSPRPPPPVSTDPVASLLTNPEVLRQLQTLQNTLAGAVNPPAPEPESDRMKKLQEMKLQEDEFDKHLAQTVPNLPFASECEFKITQSSSMIGGLHFIPPQTEATQMAQVFDLQLDGNALYGGQNSANDVEVITLDHDDSHSDDERYKRKRSRSRSRDRGRDKDGRRRRSRSRSRSRGRRHRSKSKDRKEKDKREKERDTERDKERKKRGLPSIKKDNLSVCSTTLWVGHLSKLVHQDDLSNTFGEFGDIVSIDLIVPRGCAFIVMHRRQDAARCLAKLKNHNLHGKAITLAWAPGKGVKGKDLKDYWEGDLGVSYIPWHKLKEDMDLEALEDGGMIDEDTMPEWMRKKMEASLKKASSEPPPFLMGVGGETSNHSTVDTSQPPPLPPANLMQPPMLPMVNPFQLNNRFLSMIPNLANLPLGVPPPNMAPPNMPPSMMSNLGLGLSSPFQGPPSFLPPALPPPQQQESKPTPPSVADAKLRNLSESLMNLAGQPLTMPPQPMMNQPPPPLHTPMDDNMDVEMEDADHSLPMHPDLNKPPPNMPPLSEQLQASMNATSFDRDGRRDDPRFSPGRRDRGGDARRDDRGRRRSRSRDRDQNRDRDRSGRERERRDRDRDGRDNRDRDFGRGGRDRDRDRRSGGDRDRGNRWGPPDRRDERGASDRRDDRREGPYDRRGPGPPPDRRDGPAGRRDGSERRDSSFERPGGRREGERRDSDPREKGEREKTLNERLKEMAGMKFDEPDDIRTSPRSRRLSDAKEDVLKEGGLLFVPPPIENDFMNRPPPSIVDDHRSPREARNPSPPDLANPSPPVNNDLVRTGDEGQLQNEPTEDYSNPPVQDQLPLDMDGSQQFNQQMDNRFGPDGPGPFGDDDGFGGPGPFGFDGPRPGPFVPFGPDGPGPFGPDGPGPFGPDGRFGPDGPRFRDQGPPFGDDGYGPPPDMMMDGPPPFGPPSFDGPPERFMRGGRRGRGRGRGRGRDGPDFFPRDDFGPPMMDDGFGPPMRDDFGPPMRDDFGPPMRDDFGPRGLRMRGRKFFGRGGPRGRGGAPPFRDGPPGFNPDFDGGPPEFFRGGPRGRPFGEPFHRGRPRGFRGGRGRPDFFDGPPHEFFDGPPGGHFEGGPPPFDGGPPFEAGLLGDAPPDFEGRRGRGRKRGSRLSRWGGNENGEDMDGPPDEEGGSGGDGGGTPLRDELDCGPQADFAPSQQEVTPAPQASGGEEQSGEAPASEEN